jgi:hypothetical protein
MGSDPMERIWSQAVDDGNYEEANKQSEEQAAKQRRLERQRAYIAVYHDPSSPLYRPLPREMDCIDKRQHGSGELI